MKNLLLVVLFIFIFGCKGQKQEEVLPSVNSLNKENVVPQTVVVNADTTEIICDSIYKERKYKIVLKKFDPNNDGDESRNNSLFSFYKQKKGIYTRLFKDSLFNQFQEVNFEDYNNDKVKDILIVNYSSARSNLYYYLYTLDTTTDQLKRIKGFEKIPNPKYLSKYNLIEGSAVAGKDWTRFYEITGDSIHDFGVVLYDNHKDNSYFEREYKEAIDKILKIKK